MKIYGVTGWKNTGKTGLMERLIAEFSSRGLSVSSIKHAHHQVDVDQPGRDSFRHREAGAKEVLVASPHRWALMRELRDESEPSLAELMARLAPVDLILIEGFKHEPHPKIETYRSEVGKELLSQKNPTIRAIASNAKLPNVSLPVFDLDHTKRIVDFIMTDVGL